VIFVYPCFFAIVYAYLGAKLRIWSWAFLFFCLFWTANVYVGYCGSIYVVDFQHQGDGACRPCLDQMLKLGLFSLGFGLVALILVLMRFWVHGTIINGYSILFGSLMIPFLLYSLLALAVI
jgi:hypothetical protein